MDQFKERDSSCFCYYKVCFLHIFADILRVSKYFNVFISPLERFISLSVFPSYDGCRDARHTVDYLHQPIQIRDNTKPAPHNEYFFLPLITHRHFSQELLPDRNSRDEYLLRTCTIAYQILLDFFRWRQIGIRLRRDPLRMDADIRNAGDQRNMLPGLFHIRGNRLGTQRQGAYNHVRIMILHQLFQFSVEINAHRL